ncbi:MAG: iron ABC transporter permease [Deltaproteobacteria bacterium]|nr:iron ABC transporter permease [Deltaproteobacteria bacterium]
MAGSVDGDGIAVKSVPRHLLIAPPLVFLSLFYFYPLIRIFMLSLAPEGALDWKGLQKLFDTWHYARVLWFTTWQAALSTLLTLAAALPAAFVFARYTFKGKALIRNLATVPFVLPTVVTAAAFKALLGRGGLANAACIHLFGLEGAVFHLDHTVALFLIAHVFYNFTVVLHIVGGFWERLPVNLHDAARMLGAAERTAFFKVTLPLLAPAILASSLLVFIFCFTSFGVVLILGGPRLATLEVEIYRQAVHLFNLPLAAALSLIQIVFTFCLMALYTRLERRASFSLLPEGFNRRYRQADRGADRFVVGACVGFMALLLGAPILALIIRSFATESGPGLTYYTALFENRQQSILYVAPAAAMLNSLGYALAATLIALSLGWLAAAFLATPQQKFAGTLDPLLMLPLSTSAVTLGFGFIIALDKPPFNLRSSWLLPPIAHALVALPFVIRSLLPAWRSIPQSLREAAATLGASPRRTWLTVDWPILSRALLVGAVFAFAISMGEFGATVFVARPQAPTLPLAVYRFLNYPGAMNYGQAMAMSCLLMITTAAGFLMLEKMRRASGDF